MQCTAFRFKKSHKNKIYISAIVYVIVLILISLELIKIDVIQVISKLQLINYPSPLIEIALSAGNQYRTSSGATLSILLLQITTPLIICLGVLISWDLLRQGIIDSAAKRKLYKNIMFLMFSIFMTPAALFTFMYLVGKSSVFCSHCESRSVVFMVVINFIIILMSGVFLLITGIIFKNIFNLKGGKSND